MASNEHVFRQGGVVPTPAPSPDTNLPLDGLGNLYDPVFAGRINQLARDVPPPPPPPYVGPGLVPLWPSPQPQPSLGALLRNMLVAVLRFLQLVGH